MLFGIDVASIAMMHGTKAGKVSEAPRCLATLIIRPTEVLNVHPPIGVSGQMYRMYDKVQIEVTKYLPY